MNPNSGANSQDVKFSNRYLVLKHIATQGGVSRVDLARLTGLSKMTAGKIVSELMQAGLVTETESVQAAAFGRRPIMLALSPHSPCICGILIKRELCQIILSDLGGHVIYQETYPYHTLSSSRHLLDILKELLEKCFASIQRRILAIGIACVGPLDSSRGVILKPPFFYGIENLPLADIVRERTGLPVFLVNDATAGAFSEKLFGLGVDLSNFAYLHIMNGIGAGFILKDTLYDGDSGQSGEIGHTSINFNGPICTCGNRGCLDLYANLENMRARIRELADFYPQSPLSVANDPEWNEILSAGVQHDPLAISVLEQFCSYIAYSLTNALNLLNISTVIVGYSSNNDGQIIEKLLSHQLNAMVMSSKYQAISVVHSSFNGDAPLIGSVALIVDKIFSGELKIDELEALG